MNRRDAFRTALAAAVAAMMPRPTSPTDEIARVFCVPMESLAIAPRPDCSRLLADDPVISMWNEKATKMAMAKKIDEEGWRHLTDAS